MVTWHPPGYDIFIVDVPNFEFPTPLYCPPIILPGLSLSSQYKIRKKHQTTSIFCHVFTVWTEPVLHFAKNRGFGRCLVFEVCTHSTSRNPPPSRTLSAGLSALQNTRKTAWSMLLLLTLEFSFLPLIGFTRSVALVYLSIPVGLFAHGSPEPTLPGVQWISPSAASSVKKMFCDSNAVVYLGIVLLVIPPSKYKTRENNVL